VVKELDPASEDQANHAERTTERVARERPGTAYWLITKNESGRLEVLTIDRQDEEGEEVLPVFSHQEEAEMFLWLGGWAAAGMLGRVRPESSPQYSTGSAQA
jgi:hypothetical protein